MSSRPDSASTGENESSVDINKEMMDRFRKRKCFADTELEELASQALNSTASSYSQLIKQQEHNEKPNLNISLARQSNSAITNPSYLRDAFSYDNYCSQLANLTNANIWYLQASLNRHKNPSHDLFKNNFNFLNLNQMINTPAMSFLFGQAQSLSPSTEHTSITEVYNSAESKLSFDKREDSKKIEDLKPNDEKNLQKEKYSGRAKNFSVDSLLGVV